MENVFLGNRIDNPKLRLPTSMDSQVLEELQDERLRQSRTIANQLVTIGKLKQVLDLMMSDRSTGRRTLPKLPPDLILLTVPDYISVDAWTQTDSNAESTVSPWGLDDLHTVLRAMREEKRVHKDGLSPRSVYSDDDVDSSRLRHSLLTVGTRMLSSPIPMISSAALSKWASLGFENQFFPLRHRTETSGECISASFIDDRPPSSCERRVALSEGDSPVAGLDLDMIYGSRVESDDYRPPVDSVFLSPKSNRTSGRFFHQFSDEGRIAGVFHNGSDILQVKFMDGNQADIGRYTVSPIGVSSTQSPSLSPLELTVDRFGDIELLGFGKNLRGKFTCPTIHWSDGSQWDQLRLPCCLSGDWFTGFSMIHLVPSPTCPSVVSGRWGLQSVEIIPDSITDPNSVTAVFGNIHMFGSVMVSGQRVGIEWGNGQSWDLLQPSTEQ